MMLISKDHIEEEGLLESLVQRGRVVRVAVALRDEHEKRGRRGVFSAWGRCRCKINKATILEYAIRCSEGSDDLVSCGARGSRLKRRQIGFLLLMQGISFSTSSVSHVLCSKAI